MNIKDVMDNLPPDIYEWIKNEFDGGYLEAFLYNYNLEYDNLRDFLNGFTLAVLYSHREQFTKDDWSWVRISVSAILANILTKHT